MVRLIGSLFAVLWLAHAARAEDLFTLDIPDDGAVWLQSADAAKAAGEAPDLTEAQWFARDVMLAIFYHEMGHALIDLMQLPVLGLEEDAADVLSVVMIDRLWEAQSAEAKVAATATFWAASAAETAEAGGAPVFWGVHSPDERRYYTYLCLFYGGAPEARAEMATAFGLPEDRAASCPDEFDLAAKSWGLYLDELEAAGPGQSLVWEGGAGDDGYVAQAIRDEVDYLNSVLTLPEALTVRVAPCDEANAFYSPEDRSVTMCSEMADYAESLAPAP